MASPDPEAVDVAALDRLRLDLVEAGFESKHGGTRVWEGPAFDCFTALEPNASRMRIEIRDGFPFSLPKVFVDELVGEHVNTEGDVCLWAGTDETYTWRRLRQIEGRAEEWCRRQQEGFKAEDAALDANRYFTGVRKGLVLVDLGGLPRRDTYQLAGKWDDGEHTLTVKRGSGGAVEGRSYYIARPPSSPPRTLDDFTAALTPGQRKNFDRRLKAAEKGKEVLALLFWDTDFGRNALAIVLRKKDADLVAEAIEVAATDERYKLLRAGPDAHNLDGKRAVVFGTGAIGSHAAILLGTCGFRALRLVDDGVLRPADGTRHAVGGLSVGSRKALVVEVHLRQKAPWTEVETVNERPWAPSRLTKLIEDANVVVDATGYGRFASLLSGICDECGMPLVSVALHRGGALGRVRAQQAGRQPIVQRLDETRYPVIPPDDSVEPAWEPGCGEPVNNASPARVHQIAGQVSDTAIGLALGREVEEDVVTVYDPIEAPFDEVGRRVFPS